MSSSSQIFWVRNKVHMRNFTGGRCKNTLDYMVRKYECDVQVVRNETKHPAASAFVIWMFDSAIFNVKDSPVWGMLLVDGSFFYLSFYVLKTFCTYIRDMTPKHISDIPMTSDVEADLYRSTTLSSSVFFHHTNITDGIK